VQNQATVQVQPKTKLSTRVQERRSGVDRRLADKGPPAGVRDRRVGVEPRLPDVHEVTLTPSEWDTLSELAQQPEKKTHR
jgi:hypothetical protein